MIGGFIAGNQTGSTSILVRGVGPSLKPQLPNALNDPTLELIDANGTPLATNDNWKESADRAAIEATGIPPVHDSEAAIFRAVPPAPYTAILRGKDNTVGVGLVEIYNIR